MTPPVLSSHPIFLEFFIKALHMQVLNLRYNAVLKLNISYYSRQ